MILSAFSLEGKVAVVTGCDTGLGQGMALGLAQAGCDIVGINIVEPTETIEQVTALGRRFLSLTADLRKIDGIPALLDRAVAEFGHIDILVNNAGLIRREDALEFSEKGLGRCHEPEYQERILHVSGSGETLYRARQWRQDYQYRVNALLPGRDPCAFLYRIKKRRDGCDAIDGERMG
ncbi:2-deoxy-D-gluconate 3-dehydrogenase, N-ter fragment [Escherichia coli]|nr:2-deoxy-D-gluconate 3-dehydrogenase, N-ter fragment [Escherichia coli]